MHCRLFFVFFLFLTFEPCFADNGTWDCQKAKGGEWECTTKTKPENSEIVQPEASPVKSDVLPKSKPKPAEMKPASDTVKSDSDSEKLKSELVEPDNVKPVSDLEKRNSDLEKPKPDSTETDSDLEEPESDWLEQESDGEELEADSNRPAAVYAKPPTTVAKRAGWTCTSNEEDETWNCSLFGADPKGRSKVVEDMEYSSRLLSTAFDFKQEQIFETLQAQLKYDPWENCTATSPGKYQTISGKDLRNTAPMDVNADYSEIFDKEITSFFGNVQIVRADQKVSADMASYNTVSETMDTQGHVFYTEDEISLYSDTALLNLKTDEARLRNALFISPSGPFRGSAEVVYRDSKVLSRYKEATFTSCRPGNQDWAVHAERLKMNKQTGKAAAKNAWLEFKGLPVLYTPYISFPMDDRRLTGLLTPDFGVSGENGFDLAVPYYWNIAPNYDLTIRPRFMSKRGGMLGGEFRYLTEMTAGSLGFEYLPYDILRQEPRYSGTFKNFTEFTPHLKSNIDLNYVSDDAYYDQLKNALGISNDRHLKSYADIRYDQDFIAFGTHLETYQTIDRDITSTERPYNKLPQVYLNLDHSFEEWPVSLALDNEYVNFYRNGRVSGHRFNVKPSIAFPFKTPGTFIKPKFSLLHSQYILSDQVEGKAENITRTLPVISVDSGLFFERDFKFSDSVYTHTLEPRAFYLYIPNKNQKDIPVFDSAPYDLSFSSLFRENRFSSYDRIGDANQITLAMSSRLIDTRTGKERLSLSVGEILYFRDREVGFKETNDWSNLVVELRGRLTDELSFSSGIQWNPDKNKFTRGQASISYRDKDNRIINLGYRYRRDNLIFGGDIIQSDASFRWPLYDNWSGVGRWQYSLLFNSTKESFIGLEKESCCWRFRIIWRRYANTSNDLENGQFFRPNVLDEGDFKMDEGIFVQLELKGLASFGDKAENFLEEKLKGYQRAE